MLYAFFLMEEERCRLVSRSSAAYTTHSCLLCARQDVFIRRVQGRGPGEDAGVVKPQSRDRLPRLHRRQRG